MVVPFGLTNAPAAFMGIVKNMFHGFSYIFLTAYLDDILIYSKTWDEHLKHIDLVLKKLCEHRLYANLSKCIFGAQEVEYLGFILRAGQFAMYPNNTRAIEAWQTPTSKEEFQSFSGLINYYRRFIKYCSRIANPLAELTKNEKFSLNKNAEQAFK